MNFLSAYFAIPSIYIILLAVLFVILLVEFVYLFKKRKKPADIGIQPPTAQNATGTPGMPANTLTIPTQKKSLPWKILIPIISVIVIGIIIFVAVSFLKKPSPQEELRGRATGNVGNIQFLWRNNCSPNADPFSSHPTDASCKGSDAWASLLLANTSGSPQQLQIRKQQFSCDIGGQGTSVCGKNAKDSKFIITVPAGGTFDLGKLDSQTPKSSCGSAQVDFFFTTDLNPNTGNWGTPYWGFAWTGSDCVTPPTHTPVPPTRTPTPSLPPNVSPTASLTPTIGPSPTPTITPSVQPSISPSQGPAPMCKSINFYTDLTFATKLTIDDLKNRKSGDQIFVTVIGDPGSVKGQFRVNGSSTWQILDLRRPGTNEFYANTPYTMAAGVNSFTFEGQTQDANGIWH